MVDDRIMREEVKAVYGTEGWKIRVDNMSNKQVVAIYLRFKRQGKL